MDSPMDLNIDDCWNRMGVWGRERPRCPKLEQHIHCHNCETFKSAGHRLRDRPLPADYQAEWTEIVANRKSSAEVSGLAAVIFRIEREWLALPAQIVDEIVEARTVHSLPHRPSPVLRGVVNIRGKLCLCVSMAALLGIDADSEISGQRRATRGIYPRMLVLRDDTQVFVFPADEVQGTHRYAAADLDGLPSTLTGAVNRFSTATLRAGDRNVGLLDPELLFYAFSRSLA